MEGLCTCYDHLKHFSAYAYLACQGRFAAIDGLRACNCHSGETVILGLHDVSSCQAGQGLPTISYSMSCQMLKLSWISKQKLNSLHFLYL